MAVYASDFQGGGVFEPVDPPVFLGLEPLFLALLVALGALLFFLGWMLRNGQTRRDPDAADSIWKAIDDALKAAMKADGGSLVGKAEEVQRVIHKRLGATLSIAKGLNPGLDSLECALKGRRHVPHAHACPESHEDHGDHDHDDHADDDHDVEESSSPTVTQITVINGNRDARRSGTGHGGGGHHTHPPGGQLSPRERDHAIRAAIADLNDWWRDKDARTGEMRAAHSELSAD